MHKHFAAFAVMRKIAPTIVNPTGLQVLLQTVVIKNPNFPNQRPQVKLPGGSNVDHPEEIDPFVTAVREFSEEVWVVAKVELKPSFIYPYTQDTDNLQFFYFALEGDFVGEMRKIWIHDGDNEDSSEDLSPPYWLDISEVDQRVYKTHINAVRAAIRHYFRYHSERPLPKHPRVLVG